MSMDASLAELATHFRSNCRLPDQDLARLTAAARAGGSRRDAIAAACGVTTRSNLGDVIDRATGDTGAELLFSATQHAVAHLTGSQHYWPPLTWACPECGQQVTDRALSRQRLFQPAPSLRPGGRPCGQPSAAWGENRNLPEQQLKVVLTTHKAQISRMTLMIGYKFGYLAKRPSKGV
jgi:hypothetical protein